MEHNVLCALSLQLGPLCPLLQDVRFLQMQPSAFAKLQPAFPISVWAGHLASLVPLFPHLQKENDPYLCK